MGTLKLCMLAVSGLFSILVIKQWKSDFHPLLRVALAVLFGTLAIGSLFPVIGYLSGLLGEERSRYATILLKALGIAFLTHYTAELCRECGEGGLAGGVETVGRIEILLLCIPLMEEILFTAEQLLAAGG